MSHFQMEAIDFQPRSALAGGLVALFQDIIDFRERNAGESNKIAKVHDYAIEKMNAGLPKLIKETTKLTVTAIIFSKNPDQMFATVPSFSGDWWADRTLREKVNGNTGGLGEELVGKPLTAEEMRKVSEGLNKKTGSLTQTKIGYRIVSMKLYFDTYTAFLIKETVRSRLEYFTAEELAAIVLHEIGHTMGAAERLADGYCRVQAYLTDVNYFFKNASLSEKLEYVKTSVPRLNDKIPLKKPLTKAIVTAETLYKERGKGTVLGTLGGALYSIMDILLMTILTILTVESLMIVNTLFEAFLIGPLDATKKNLDWNDMKLSDLMSTRYNTALDEKEADTFAVRHGMGKELIGALNKIRAAMDQIGISNYRNLPVVYLTSATVFYMYKSLATVSNFLYPLEIFTTYGTVMFRNKNILNECIVALKDSSLSPEDRNMYMTMCESVIREIEHPSIEVRAKIVGNAILRFLSNMLSPAMIALWVANGKFAKEYNTLLENVEALKSNLLYLRAAQLAELAKGDAHGK